MRVKQIKTNLIMNLHLKNTVLLCFLCIVVYAQDHKKQPADYDAWFEERIKTHRLKKYKDNLAPYRNHTPKEIFRMINEQYKDEPNARLTRLGFDLAVQADRLGDETKDKELKELAVNLAEYTLERYFLPDGTFLEYDWNTWVKKEEMWRTVPWGVAFHGNSMADAYDQLADNFTPRQREEWKAKFKKTGNWIYKNPFLGTYVFNCTIDLNRLLWRIGNIIQKEEWKEWSLKTSHTLIKRHVDDQGFIHWENEGVSGRYQLVGTEFLSQFAWESRDPVLVTTMHKIFAAAINFTTPTLLWMGNFGTRTNYLDQFYHGIILIEAALNNPYAAYILKKYGQPDWSDDLDLWKQALNNPVKEPPYKAIAEFPGISGTVFREGDFQAWFFNYPKSLWARGFAGLWMKSNDAVIFSTMHSVPGKIEAAKLRYDNPDDWAGFPHVRVNGATENFDSQQKMEDLQIDKKEGIQVKWRENMLSPLGKNGGEMKSHYTFKNNIMTMDINLAKLAGQTNIDFHILKGANQVYGLWAGSEVDSIRAKALPVKGGGTGNRTFSVKDTKDFALQVGNNVYAFQCKEIPNDAQVILGLFKPNGLHTPNEGGIRMRIVLPEKLTSATLSLNFEGISDKDADLPGSSK